MIAWISPAIYTVLLGAVIWFCRTAVREWLAAGVRHDFDVKLEEFRAELRQSEQRVDSIRDSALEALSQANSEVTKRRLLAADQIWKGTKSAYAASGMITQAQILNLENLAKEAADPKIQTFMNTVSTPAEAFLKASPHINEAFDARPFVSPMAWALYEAYSGIVHSACAKLMITKAGVNPAEMMDASYLSNLLKAALPDMTEEIDKGGPAIHSTLAQKIHERLARELIQSVRNPENDQEQLERAAKIAAAASKLSDNISAHQIN